MMRWRIGGLRAEVHPLLPLMLLLALQTGLGKEALAVLPALFVHESAHLLAARCCGVQVDSFALTPFGAAIRLRQPWNAQSWRIACVSLAGPAANLAVMLLGAAAGYARAIGPQSAALVIEANFLLMAVNLLPALPLDGGRALCAWLSGRIGAARAVRAGAAAGYALGGALLAAAVWAGIARGIWNIALIGSAGYIVACAAAESGSAAGTDAQALVLRREELGRRRALPVKLIAVTQETELAQAMRLIGPGSVHMLVLMDERMRPAGILPESELLRRFPADAGERLSAFVREKEGRWAGECIFGARNFYKNLDI